MIGGIELRVMVRRQRTASDGVWPGSLGRGRLGRSEANQKKLRTRIGEYCFSNRRLKWSTKFGTKMEGEGFRYDERCMDELADVVSEDGIRDRARRKEISS